MKEQELYKTILKKIIDQTNSNDIQTVDQLVNELILEITSHISTEHKNLI